jgi:hypothetical protein
VSIIKYDKIVIRAVVLCYEQVTHCNLIAARGDAVLMPVATGLAVMTIRDGVLAVEERRLGSASPQSLLHSPGRY